MQFAVLDIIVVAVVFLSAVLAMVRGFSREILSVGSWMTAAAAGLAVALWDDPLTPVVKTYVENDMIATIVAIAIVFILVLIIVSVITMRISDFIIDSSIGALDRTLGFIFGAARGLLLFTVVIGMFNWLYPPSQGQPEWVANAKTKPLLDNLSVSLIAALPDDIDEFVHHIKGFVAGEEVQAPAGDTEEKAVPAPLDNGNGSGISTPQRNEIERLIEGTDTNQQ